MLPGNINQKIIYIRPLVAEDARVSYHWRNNPKIWRFTGSKPNQVITHEIETKWIEEVLLRPNERRFAICETENSQYIGNVFFTNITEKDAHIHIFIGEIAFWGKGRANVAACLLCKYGFETLQLDSIIAEINEKNSASINVGLSVGFELKDNYYDEVRKLQLVKLQITRERFYALRGGSDDPKE